MTVGNCYTRDLERSFQQMLFGLRAVHLKTDDRCLLTALSWHYFVWLGVWEVLLGFWSSVRAEQIFLAEERPYTFWYVNLTLVKKIYLSKPEFNCWQGISLQCSKNKGAQSLATCIRMSSDAVFESLNSIPAHAPFLGRGIHHDADISEERLYSCNPGAPNNSCCNLSILGLLEKRLKIIWQQQYHRHSIALQASHACQILAWLHQAKMSHES